MGATNNIRHEHVTSANGGNGRQKRCLPCVKGHDGEKKSRLIGPYTGPSSCPRRLTKRRAYPTTFWWQQICRKNIRDTRSLTFFLSRKPSRMKPSDVLELVLDGIESSLISGFLIVITAFARSLHAAAVADQLYADTPHGAPLPTLRLSCDPNSAKNYTDKRLIF